MKNQQADIEIIHAVLGGDTAAFKSLVGKYQDMVYTIAFRIIANREEAEDVAQEAFIKCFRHLKSYNFKSQFSTWLYRITYNHAIDATKKKSNKKPPLALDETSNYSIEVPSTSEGDLDHKILQYLLKEAIEQLSEEERIIVILYYYDDQPLKEIARVIGVKENNVKIKLHRIRSKLMQQLASKKEIISAIIS